VYGNQPGPDGMQQWEFAHLLVDRAPYDMQAFMQTLNAWGAQGWQCAAAMPGNKKCVLIFQRPVQRY
jgi:hypothetical protein